MLKLRTFPNHHGVSNRNSIVHVYIVTCILERVFNCFLGSWAPSKMTGHQDYTNFARNTEQIWKTSRHGRVVDLHNGYKIIFYYCGINRNLWSYLITRYLPGCEDIENLNIWHISQISCISEKMPTQKIPTEKAGRNSLRNIQMGQLSQNTSRAWPSVAALWYSAEKYISQRCPTYWSKNKHIQID